MAIPVASLNASPQPLATADAPSATQRAASGDPFQTVLATATTQAQQTTATPEVAVTDDVTLATEEVEIAVDEVTDETLAGLLAFTAQVLTLPVNAAVAQVTGKTPETPTITTVPGEGGTRTRADQLALTSAQLPTTAIGVPTLPIPDQVNTSVANSTPELAPVAAPTSANAGQPVTPQTAVAVALRGGTSSIPAQAPIVVNLNPPVLAPVDPSVTNPPVAEPTAPLAPTAIPDAQVGDRPATTGDRFAAIASAGAQLTPTEAPRSGIFANAFDQEAAITPTVSAAVPVIMHEAVPSTGVPVTTEAVPLIVASRPLTAEAVRTVLPLKSDVRPTDEPTADEPSIATAPGVVATTPTPFVERSTPVTTSVSVQATPAAQIADAVVSQAQILERPGSVEFQMRLDPPELGRLQIRLVARGDEIHGQVLVADDAVRRMIESQLPELRQRLEASGVNVQTLNIATDPNTGGSRNPYQNESVPEFAPRSDAPAPAPRARINRATTSSLDVTV